MVFPTSTPQTLILLDVSSKRQLHTRIFVYIHALEIYVWNLMPLLSVFFSFPSLFPTVYLSNPFSTLQSKQMANHPLVQPHRGVVSSNLPLNSRTISLTGTDITTPIILPIRGGGRSLMSRSFKLYYNGFLVRFLDGRSRLLMILPLLWCSKKSDSWGNLRGAYLLLH